MICISTDEHETMLKRTSTPSIVVSPVVVSPVVVSPEADAQVEASIVAGGSVVLHGSVVSQFVIKAELEVLNGGFFIAVPIPGFLFLDCASSRHRSNVCTETPISFATAPTFALSGGNNRATTMFLNIAPYRAIVHPYRPQVQDHIEATTILTQGAPYWRF